MILARTIQYNTCCRKTFSLLRWSTTKTTNSTKAISSSSIPLSHIALARPLPFYPTFSLLSAFIASAVIRAFSIASVQSAGVGHQNQLK